MRKCMTLIAVFFITVVGSAQAQESTEGFRGVLWGWAQVRAERAFGKLYPTAEQDARGLLHYPDSLAGLACEIVPLYEDYTFASVLMRFYPGWDATEPEALYQSVAEQLTSELGVPAQHVEGDVVAFTCETGVTAELWQTPETRGILAFYNNYIGRPRIDVLLMSNARWEDLLAEAAGSDSADVRAAFDVIVQATTQPQPSYLFRHTLSSTTEDLSAKVEIDETAVATRAVDPDYPAEAKKLGIEGTVWVQARVDASGKVLEAHIVRPADTDVGFEKAAVSAAKKFKYKPALRDGEPVAVWVTYPVHFKPKR